MVTALNEASDFERGVQAGTDDFLTKPVNKVELLCRIRSLLRVRHLQPARAHPGLPGRVRGHQPGHHADRQSLKPVRNDEEAGHAPAPAPSEHRTTAHLSFFSCFFRLATSSSSFASFFSSDSRRS